MGKVGRPAISEEERVISQKKKEWKADPYKFVIEAIRFEKINPDYVISDQQREALRIVGQKVIANIKKYEERKGNLDEMIKKKKLKPYTELQSELRDKLGISIMAGKGVGKSAFLSWIIIWFLTLFDQAKIIATSTKQDQLKTIIWAGVSTWRNARLFNSDEYAFIFREYIKITGERIYFDTSSVGIEASPRFCKMAICQKNANIAEMQSTLQGDHSPNMLIIADEASGIPDPVFHPLEETMTEYNNFALITFNPNKNSGYAHDTHFGKLKKRWHQLHWSAEDSTLVPNDLIERAREDYGIDSDRYRVSILGLPPQGGDEVLIPYSWVSEAAYRERNIDTTAGIVLGIDPARHGADQTVFVLRQGSKILDIVKFNKLDTYEVASIAQGYILDNNVAACFIDTVGVGGGVFDQLVRTNVCRFISVEVTRKALEEHKFNRLRDELWWKCREWFEKSAPDIPNDTDLINQLTDIKYSDEGGKIRIEQKSQMKKRTGGSPDIADALNLTFMYNDRMFARENIEQEERYSKKTTRFEQSSWMGA